MSIEYSSLKMMVIRANVYGGPNKHQHSLYTNINLYEVGTFSFILQMQKLRHGQIKWLAQGYS